MSSTLHPTKNGIIMDRRVKCSIKIVENDFDVLKDLLGGGDAVDELDRVRLNF